MDQSIDMPACHRQTRKEKKKKRCMGPSVGAVESNRVWLVRITDVALDVLLESLLNKLIGLSLLLHAVIHETLHGQGF